MGICCNKQIKVDDVHRLPVNLDTNISKTLPSKGEKFEAYVKKVYDGDTITVLINLDEVREVKVRIAGIDAPELKPLKSTPNREIIVANAKKCQKMLEDKVLNKIVMLTITDAHEKWGRFLADINYNGENISEFMVSSGLVNLYDGKKKKEFEFKEEEHQEQ